MIGLENYQHNKWQAIVFIVGISVLLLVAYLKAPLHHHEHDIEDILVAIWVPIGAVACYSLHTFLHLEIVIAAGITGTIASFLPNLNKKSAYLSKLPVAIYCGTFVGMSSVNVAKNVGFILSAGIFTGVLLLLSKNLFLGVGGKLGTLAFVGVTIASFLYYILHI